MNFKITLQEARPLLSRTKVKAEVLFEDATPSNADIAKKIAAATKKDVSLVVMKKIDVEFGTRKAEVDAYVYDSAEAKASIERKTKAMKDAEKKVVEDAAKAKEEKAEAPKEEAKPEEAKEEKKEEAKPEEKAE